MIFNLVYEGKSYVEVCKILNQNNIPTKIDFKIKNGYLKDNTKKQKRLWKPNAIAQIIKNEVYIRNTINFKSKRVICGCCRYSLKYNMHYKDKKYSCRTKNENNIKCFNGYILESELKNIVSNILKITLLSYLQKISNNNNINNNIKKYTYNLQKLKNNKLNLYENYAQQKITLTKYLQDKNALNQNINETEKIIQNLKLQTINNNRTLNNYLKCNELTENIVDNFIKNIYICDRNIIKIEWKFKYNIKKG